MSGAEILSLIGIIIGLAVLVVLVMKGINIYVVAFIASIIVAVFGRMNLYEALKTELRGRDIRYYADHCGPSDAKEGCVSIYHL